MPAAMVTQHRQSWAGFEGRHDEAKYPGPASLSDLVNSQIECFIRHTHTHTPPAPHPQQRNYIFELNEVKQNTKTTFRTLRANTTLNRIIVGISLFGEGSVFETWTERTIKRIHWEFRESFHVTKLETNIITGVKPELKLCLLDSHFHPL